MGFSSKTAKQNKTQVPSLCLSETFSFIYPYHKNLLPPPSKKNKEIITTELHLLT